MDKIPSTYKSIVRDTSSPIGKIETLDTPTPGKGQVLIKMHYAPINPSDLSNLKGHYAATDNKIGFEGCGEIVAVGEELVQPLQVGEKVSVAGGATWAEYSLQHSSKVMKIPPGVEMQQAACPMVNPGTVVAMSFILKESGVGAAIHTVGSSALGRMMIRYFKKQGLKLINIVRKQQYVDELLKDGADYVLNSSSETFEKDLKELAEKEKATVCFEAVAGEFTGKVLRNMPNGSTTYIYGSMSGSPQVNVDVGDLIFKGKQIKGFWLNQQFQRKPEEVQKMFGEIMGNLASALSTKIQKVFKFTELADALELYAKAASEGKILLQP